MKPTEIIIFTDGSSRGNPGPGGWGAAIAIPGLGKDADIVELGGGEEMTTNNRMEMTSALEALKFLRTRSSPLATSVVIHTDSSYLINGITKWAKNWRRNNWLTAKKEPVLNKDLWEKLLDTTEKVEEKGKIIWNRIKGHSGIKGNERVDAIATSFADGTNTDLFRGVLKNYPVDILNFSEDKAKKIISSEKKQRSRAKPYSYVSLVGGKIMTHKTWAECEVRVKGVSGTKFKKALSPEDEKRIIADWKK